jgi:hypothetical protein
MVDIKSLLNDFWANYKTNKSHIYNIIVRPEQYIDADNENVHNNKKTDANWLHITPFSIEALPDTFYRRPVGRKLTHIYDSNDFSNYYWESKPGIINPNISRSDKENSTKDKYVNMYVVDKNTGKISEEYVKNPNIKISTKHLGFIGGSQEEVRRKLFDKINAQDFAKRIGDMYNVDPNLLLRRFSVEGITDNYIKKYNNEYTP